VHTDIQEIPDLLTRTFNTPPGDIDFVRTPSLDTLIHYWETEAESNANGQASLARQLLEGFPAELRGPLNPAAVAAHRPLVDALCTAVFPTALQRLPNGAMCTPGSFQVQFCTPRFQRELLGENGDFRGKKHEDGTRWDLILILFVFLGICRRFYNLNFEFEKSIIHEVEDEATGLKRYYQIRGHLDLLEMRLRGELPVLPPDAEALLAPRLDDLDLWRELIPPDRFELYGLMVYEAFDVTEEVTLSAIKQELVSRDPLLDPERFQKITRRFRSLLGRTDIHVKVVATQEGKAFGLTSCEGDRNKLTHNAIDIASMVSPECQECMKRGEAVLVDDLATAELCSPAMHKARADGALSMVMLPLMLEEELQGVLMLTSKQARGLNSLTPVRVREALPLLALAVKRTMESLNHKVQAVMKERFTAIHPAVEWRFRASAHDIVKGKVLESDDILFPDVYPLFSTSDVRNSTVIRNRSIQSDLTSQLRGAMAVLEAAYAQRALPYLASRSHRLQGYIAAIEPGLNTADEPRILDFLRHEIEPLFESLGDFGPQVMESIAAYRGSLDPKLGLLYQERKKYEESMGTLRDLVGAVLYARQEEAQSIFPHYFELQKTDGVDHTIYIGASLEESARFDMLYVKNLRLWQLLAVAAVARESARILPELPLPLELAHLILVQDAPLSIRFSLDEKRFNVDGAYNARYEILKKRIDKAEVRETGERLTQPRKIAVVYSHPREAAEYREYFDYLQAIGELEPGVEEHELAALQGVQGLRALRVTVTVPTPSTNGRSLLSKT